MGRINSIERIARYARGMGSIRENAIRARNIGAYLEKFYKSGTKAAKAVAERRIRMSGDWEGVGKEALKRTFGAKTKGLAVPNARAKYREITGRAPRQTAYEISSRAAGHSPSWFESDVDTKSAIAELKGVKARAPKFYQKVKDLAARSITSTKGRTNNPYMPGPKSAGQKLTNNLLERLMGGGSTSHIVGPSSEDLMRVLDYAKKLTRRGIMPAAAAGAGVAASRKPKAQGYKYGGMVKRSRKGC